MEVGLFEVRDKDLAARIGRLYTPHGVLETPALLPVVDIARQEVGLEEIKSLGFNAVITNAYLAWRRWREEAIEKGIHGLLGFQGIIMTDSGAYQLMRYGSVDVSPEEIVEFQKQIGSDIAVILDVPTGSADAREKARWSVEETLRRARRAIQLIGGDERLWTLPVQGGRYTDLVEYAAREASKLSRWYRVYALGSPTVLLERYSYQDIVKMIIAARFNLPLSHPLHLFGAGHPMIIPFAVALGVDMFDSASYILYARDNRYMTPRGTLRLEDIDYFPCSCPICARYTPQELLEMPPHERTRLLALHNLYVLRQELNSVKLAIREGRLWELLMEKAHAHPSLKRALQVLVKHSDLIEKLDPRVKGGEVHGLFFYGLPEDHYHPRVTRHKRLVTKRYKPRSNHLVLVPVHPDVKPFTTSSVYREARRTEHQATILGYTPPLGIIPEELAETYPLSQYEAPLLHTQESIRETINAILEAIKAYKPSALTIYYCPQLPWSSVIAEELSKSVDGVKLVKKRIECSDTHV